MHWDVYLSLIFLNNFYPSSQSMHSSKSKTFSRENICTETKHVRQYTNHPRAPFSKKDFYYFIAYESLCSGGWFNVDVVGWQMCIGTSAFTSNKNLRPSLGETFFAPFRCVLHFRRPLHFYLPPFIHGDCWISHHQLALGYACTWLRYYFRKWEFLHYTQFEAFDFVIYRLDDLEFCLPDERVWIRGTFQHTLMIFLYAINVWERKINLRFKNRIYMETIRRNFWNFQQIVNL